MNLFNRCNGKIFTLILFFSVCSSVSSADVIVIVHKDSPVASISQTELGRIFLGTVSAFEDGSKATPINQVMTSAARKEFDKSVLNRSEAQMKAYWSKRMFSGEGVPPEEVNGDLNVVQKVLADKSVIGYIEDSSALNDGVKQVSIK